MARIDLKNIAVEFPVYNVNARSFKKQFLRLTTGGAVSKDANQHVVVRSLDNLSLSIQDGDRIGLIGHNGSGKSTLLRLLSGIYEPTQGSMRIEGKTAPMLDLVQGMETEFTGYENITLRGTLLGLSRKQINQHIAEIAELTGLGDYLAMPIRTYSQGMLLRLAFAISTSTNADILLIDEIFTAGDASFMEKAQKRMIQLLNQSSIVVMATHVDSLVKDFCNKALVLEGGCMKYFGDVNHALALYHNKI